MLHQFPYKCDYLSRRIWPRSQMDGGLWRRTGLAETIGLASGAAMAIQPTTLATGIVPLGVLHV